MPERSHRFARSWLIAGAVSLAVHGALAVGARFAVRQSGESPAARGHGEGVLLELTQEPPTELAPTPSRPEPPEPEASKAEPPELRPGIDGGATTPTETWLGFATGSPLAGPVVESFEQAAFSKTDGGVGTPGTTASAEPPSLPAPAQADDPAGQATVHVDERPGDDDQDRSPVRPQDGSPIPSPGDAVSPMTPPSTDVPAEAGVLATPKARDVGLFERLGLDRAALALRGAIRRASATHAAKAPDPAVSHAPASTAPGGASGRPGEKSDRETDAAAKTEALVWSPGRPLAAEGVEFHPAAGAWSITTRRTTRPRDALVTIEFNMRGDVVHADFVPGRGTGYQEVDGPLISSLYDWRISGSRLDALRRADPDQTVSFTIRIVFSR